MDENKEIQYVTNVEDLDMFIQDLENGITITVPDDIMMEINIRRKELMAKYADEDEEELIGADLLAKHEEFKKKVETERRTHVTKAKDIIIPLTDKEKEEIRKGMESSIVRDDPNLIYHIDDSVLTDSEKKRELYEKLGNLRNLYFNEKDWRNAMLIIKEAIQYSLDHDYPWLSREEVYKAYKDGKIKFSFCKAPQLMLDHRTPLKDPNILAGIMDGRVEMRSKNEKDEEYQKNRKIKEKSKMENPGGVEMEYHVVSDIETDEMIKLQKQGYDCPGIGALMQLKKNKYNRFALPSSNRFSYVSEAKKAEQKRIQVELENFDWDAYEDPSQAYFDIITNKKTTQNDIVKFVVEKNKENGVILAKNFGERGISFWNAMSAMDESGNMPAFTTSDDPTKLSNSLQVNREAMEIENKIMEMIKQNNPNTHNNI
jgi:hypothetical protein